MKKMTNVTVFFFVLFYFSVAQAGKITAEIPFNLTAGTFIFSVPSSGMEQVSSNGSVGTPYQFDGDYWVPYASSVLSQGVYGYFLTSNWTAVDFSLRGMFDNPPHNAVTSRIVTREALIRLSLNTLNINFGEAAVYYYAYVPFLVSTTVNRICDIDNTVYTDFNGDMWLYHILAVILPNGQGVLTDVLLADQAKTNKTVLRAGQLFGLVLEITPYFYPG